MSKKSLLKHFVVQTFQLYDAIYDNKLPKLHKYQIKKQTIAFINKIWQHNIISTFLHRSLLIKITKKNLFIKSISFNEIWIIDQSVFTQAVRNYEAFLFEYANKKKYKINTIEHSKDNKTSTEFSLDGAFEQTDFDKILQSISEIDLIETDFIKKQSFDKNKQSLRIKKQNVLNKYFNYFNNFVDQIDIKKSFFQTLANMFYKNIWNNFWT